jgi:endonuclease/exonuclease/phosphatase family metal-dependent hydrolase
LNYFVFQLDLPQREKNMKNLHLLIKPLLITLLLSSPALCQLNASRPLKPPQRKFFRQLNDFFSGWHRAWPTIMIDRAFFQTGVYHALTGCREARILQRTPKQTNLYNNLRVVTANLMLFPAPMGRNQLSRIGLFAECIQPLNADLIMLQEVWDQQSLRYLAEKFFDYDLIFVPSAVYNRSGLVVFSKIQIKSVQFIQYPLSIKHNLEELLAHKGALVMEAEINSRLLLLVNTHLYSAPPDRRCRPNPGQFTFLQQKLAEISSGTVIIAGDLNLRPVDLDSLLKKDYLPDSCPLLTAGSPQHNQKLDHIIIKPAHGEKIATGRVECPIAFSDHSPVQALIKLLPLSK